MYLLRVVVLVNGIRQAKAPGLFDSAAAAAAFVVDRLF